MRLVAALAGVRYVVLDEVDRLMDVKGMLVQIDRILAACSHPGVTRALFSATLPSNIETLAKTVLLDPIRITVGVRNTAVAAVQQRLVCAGSEDGKVMAVQQLLRQGATPPILIFVHNKRKAHALYKRLLHDGVKVDFIHGEQRPMERDVVLASFRMGHTFVLVATDLMARGIDIAGINMVVNYDLPRNVPDYIHRVGRAGRAGASGSAVTLFTNNDLPNIRSFANTINQAGGEVPTWTLKLPKNIQTPRKGQGGRRRPRSK